MLIPIAFGGIPLMLWLLVKGVDRNVLSGSAGERSDLSSG